MSNKYKVTLAVNGGTLTHEIEADIVCQDPHWTTFFTKVDVKGEPDTMVASFQSGNVTSVVKVKEVKSA